MSRSGTEEDVSGTSDQDNEMNVDVEQETAIGLIMSDTEALEAKATPSSGKKRKRKEHKVENPHRELMKMLLKLQGDVESLKVYTPFEPVEDENHNVPQLSTARNTQQLSTAQNSQQLSTAQNSQQLSTAQNSQQLSTTAQNALSPADNSTQPSPAKRPRLRPLRSVASVTNTAPAAVAQQLDDVVDIHANENDPLLQETEMGQSAAETSEDEEYDDQDNIFNDLVDDININDDDELLGDAIPENFAEKINKIWTTKMSKTLVSTLLLKYQTPNNLGDLRVPKMNREIWRLISRWQRKADISMSTSQRALVKAASAVLKLHDYFANQDKATRQIAMHTTVDIISILAKVNRDLTIKRKTMIRPALKGDFKTLATSTKTSGENLFGDTLTQDIKDIQVKKKIEDTGKEFPRRTYRSYGNRYNNNNNNNYGAGNFLGRGRGRGRGYYRGASHHSNSYHNQSSHSQGSQKKH